MGTMGKAQHIALQHAPSPQPQPARVVTKAALRAAERLGLSQSDLAEVIGVSPATVSRMAGGIYLLDPATKQGELALVFLRVYRSLDTLLGGEQDKLKAWFEAPNSHLDGVPAKLVRSVEGLARVADYLDAMRGKL
jgi:transcriptional regulator with XRE-family HTH domain